MRRYDVRLDQVVAARDAQRIDVFLTLKNVTATQQYASSGSIMVRLDDSDGVGKQNGQILRPTVAGTELFGSTPVIQPGGELRIKFSFHPDTGTTPARVTVIEGDRRAEFPAS